MLRWGLVSVVLVFLLLCGLLESPNLLNAWVVLELLTLGGVCLFFISDAWGVSFSSLFYYLVGAGYSSFLIIAGVLINPWFNLLLVVSVLLKLGVFPFVGWLYRVVVGSNWIVVWFFSGPLKISFVLIAFGLGVSNDLVELVSLAVVVSFYLAAMNFWSISRSWRHIWCHMLVGSGSGLLIIVFNGSLSWSLVAYIAFLVWSTLVILYLSSLSESCCFQGCFFFFFFLITFPGSLAMMYKIIVALSLVGSSSVVFIFWIFFSVVEQGYLINKVLELSVCGKGPMYFNLV